MNGAGRFSGRSVSPSTYPIVRLAWAVGIIIALAAGAGLPTAAAVPSHRAEACPTVVCEPSKGLAKARVRRLASDTLAQWPLRFEASGQGRAERFLARAGE